MKEFLKLFRSSKCAVIGMIHAKALPGTPKSCHSVEQLVNLACEEAALYKRCGVDGVLVENMFDLPYVKATDSGPEITAVMTRICSEVKKVVSAIPCGVQILAGNNIAALAVASASGCQFIRAEGFAFAHVADEGFMEACAGPLLRYRKAMAADDIFVLCDVKKKHSSHAITSDVSLAETAKAISFFVGDGVIITGSETGKPPSTEDLTSVQEVTDLPVLIGSGVNINNVNDFISADALIIGSHFKADDNWRNTLEPERILRFLDKVRR